MTTGLRRAGAVLGALCLSAAAGSLDDLKTLYEPATFEGADGGTLLYRLMKPGQVEVGKSYPLVVFLHGAGGRGNDNFGQIRDQPKALEILASDAMRAKHPCFVMVPQCPVGKQWVDVPWSKGSYSQKEVAVSADLKRVIELVEKLQKGLPVDRTRCYAAGLSMGGYGTWDIILRRPEMFAAAAPCCGAGDPSGAGRIKHVGVWAFHGGKDGVVPVRGSREMFAALEKAGAEPRYNEFPGVGHFSWNQAFTTKGLWDWMFAHRGGDKK